MFAHDHQARCGVDADTSVELAQQALRQTDFFD